MEATQPDIRSADSNAGDIAHEIAAAYFHKVGQTGDWHPFVPEDYLGSDQIRAADVVASFIEMAKRVFDDWCAALKDPTAGLSLIVEERIVWLDKFLEPVNTGQPDVLFLAGRVALVLDLKSLYGEHAASAENLQLRNYAVLVNKEHGCDEVTVAICQPRVSREPQVCRYGPEDLVEAEKQILEIIERSKADDAPLIAGEKQCAYCRANAVCPAAKQFALSLGDTLPTPTPAELQRAEAKEIVATLSIEQRAMMHRRAGTVKKILDAVDENLKSLSAEELATVGLELVTSRGDRMITSAQEAFPRVSDVLTVEEFNACCSVGITKLEDAYRKKTKLKVKETKAKLEEKLGALLGRKADSKTLANIKPTTAQPVLALQG